MATETGTQLHGGRLIARRLRAHGVGKLFTLSGGHLFSIYDGCREEGIELIDVRHEQTAAFAAEGWAKVTRTPGVCALTAGPGITNGMSAIASASQNGSPMVVLGGRAPMFRWGQGSLQEIDHVPFVRPLVKSAATSDSTAEIPGLVDEALRVAITPHTGPAFVDFPLDHVFMAAEEPPEHDAGPSAPSWAGAGASGAALDRAISLLRDAERPVIMAGTGLYWGHGEVALRRSRRSCGFRCSSTGSAAGACPLITSSASRARDDGLSGADVALVIGVPLDFRLGFGAVFAPDAEVIVSMSPSRADHPRPVAAELYGALPATLDALRAAGRQRRRRARAWVSSLRAVETEKRAAEAGELADDRAPLHPMRIYGELAQVLDRDAIVIGDGGDFVSFAGRVVDSYEPGCWLDPGPSAAWARAPGTRWRRSWPTPSARSCCCSATARSGSPGWSSTRWPATASGSSGVIGNNGIWALEKHPMEAIYGYSVVADLRPGTRYDQVAEALGCDGELVRTPGELRPALERAFAAGGPALVNVLTDPAMAYPRRSNLACTRTHESVKRKPPALGGRLPIQVWPNRDGQGYVPERAG